MKVLFDNDVHKISAFNCKIDSLGPFEPCPAKEMMDVVGLYGHMRLVENDSKTTIQKVMTYPNCHPDIKEGAEVQIILWEQKMAKTENVISLTQDGIESSDLEVYYSHFEKCHASERKGAKAKTIQSWGFVFIALLLMASVIFIIPGFFILIASLVMVFKSRKYKKSVMKIINLAPTKAQLAQSIKQYFAEQKAIAGNRAEVQSQGDQRLAVAQ